MSNMSNIDAIKSQELQNTTITSALNCSVDSATSNSLSWVAPSTYTTTLGGNCTITTNTPSWMTVGSSIDYGYFKDTTMETLFLYLKEEEISEIFNKILERESDSEKIKSIVSRVVRVRHFSEEFLLEYISYMDMSDITVMHNADIKSGEYPNIALIIEGLK